MWDVPTHPFSPAVSRRTALRWSGRAALTTVGLAAATGCASDTDSAQELDTLTAHLRLARRDAAAAGALIAVAPDLAGSLGVVQNERNAHADALAAEIGRVEGPDVGGTTGAAASTTPEPAPPPTLAELKSYLAESQRSGADSARDESGYRAGLLGSISAACAVQLAVVLS